MSLFNPRLIGQQRHLVEISPKKKERIKIDDAAIIALYVEKTSMIYLFNLMVNRYIAVLPFAQ